MSATLETWIRFRTETENCSARLNSRLRESTKSLLDLLRHQADAFETAVQTTGGSAQIDNLFKIFDIRAELLLAEPIRRFRLERVQQRVSEAFDDWDKTMEGIIGAMPESLTMTAQEWMSLAGTLGMSFLSRARLRLRRKPLPVGFRQNLLYGYHIQRAGRLKVEGRLLRLLAQCSLELVVPWQSMLQIWLPQLLLRPRDSSSLYKEAQRFRLRLRAYEKSSNRILQELVSWSSNSPERIANRLPFSSAVHSSAELENRTRNHFRHREFWMRQIRAVESDMDLAFRLMEAEREITERAGRLRTDVTKEHQELMDELGRVVMWLEDRNHSQSPVFPPGEAEIVSAGTRLGAWQRSVEDILDDVPETVEVASRVAARPRWRQSFSIQTPRSVFCESLEWQSRTVFREGLNHLERQHRSIVREIERAREVVAFASETARLGQTEDLEIEREGIENARSLLQFHRTQTQDVPPEVERSLVSALAGGFLRTHTVLEAGQFGVARQAALYGFPSALRKLLSRLIEVTREGAEVGARYGADLNREVLIRIGWVSAPTTRIPHVIRRGFLSQVLGAESRPARLPMIYQRLFRLAPIEDPRFLVGRQDEMNALVEARYVWEHGREAAVILVGERGSGKTSLLNCAVQNALGGLEIIRSEFSKRLTRKEEMYEFLGALLQVEPQAVETTLNSGKRVIILEELERTYLRRVNHFGALRALLNLISKTSNHTLWLISVNYFAFRLLNPSLRLDPHFSHRINAMAIDRDGLREAILLRHNLSGLRLRFAPAPTHNSYTERVREFARVEADPEVEFFEAIYRQSGGVFRTAFALWQRYIDRAEAGLLYMRPPGTPQYKNVVDKLNDLDLFTLAAILQHGSLTPGEHSIIFQVETATSAAWLDNLLARELIELDPGREGLRVVPEAGEIVRQTLFTRNVA